MTNEEMQLEILRLMQGDSHEEEAKEETTSEVRRVVRRTDEETLCRVHQAKQEVVFS